MLKITNQDYNIPRIFATEWKNALTSGTTTPFLILGMEETTGIRESYVIKPFGHPRIYPKAIARELIGAWIGMELGLNVFEPVLITVSSEFTETMRGNSYYGRFVDSVGLNFGTKHVPGIVNLINGAKLTALQTEQAKGIICFDMFVSNADRRIINPNLLISNEQLVIFDHELAFSFVLLMTFLKNRTPWVFDTADLELLHQHFLYPKFKGTILGIDDFIESLHIINDEFWTKACALLPEAWLTEEIEEIRAQLNLIIQNRAIFATELSTAILR